MGMGKEMSMNVMNKSGVVKGYYDEYVHEMSCISAIDPQEICSGDGIFLVEKKVVEKGKNEEIKALNTCSSSSTSSIGKNSDISGKSMENSGDIEEVQSSYKGPLDAMEALEEVLPIRKGISRFYNGKSKSFASLGDASSSTSPIKELAKPENAYTRRRRNLLACNLTWEESKNINRNSPLRSNSGGVSKRVSNLSSRSSLALAVTMSSSSSNSTIYNTLKNENLSPSPYSNTINSGSPSSLLRNRLHYGSSPRQNLLFSGWRSLSLADLQHCVSVTSTTTTHELDDGKTSHA